MVIATLALPYEQLVNRAHVIWQLEPADIYRVLERIVARYPEAVATVLDDMGAPAPADLPGAWVFGDSRRPGEPGLPGPDVPPPGAGRPAYGFDTDGNAVAFDLVDGPIEALL